jgi:hypothetical protein
MSANEKRMRVAAALVSGGLAVELITLHWPHPLAFVVFAGLGGLALGVGIITFLTVLFRPQPK